MRFYTEREIRDAYLDSLDDDRDAYESLLELRGDYHDDRSESSSA